MLVSRAILPRASGSTPVPFVTRRAWATASIGGAPDTLPGELTALGDHVDHCNGSRGKMFGLRCAADTLHGFLAPRFVTTLVVVAFVFGIVSLAV